MTNQERVKLTRKWERGEMRDEEYVRAVWDYAVCCGIEGSRFVSINGDLWKVPGNWKTDAEAWQAAADFTRNRIEDARQLEGEMEMALAEQEYDLTRVVGAICCGYDDTVPVEVTCLCRTSRTIQRLTSLLAEAERGIK